GGVPRREGARGWGARGGGGVVGRRSWEGPPAGKGGVQDGDVITSVAGKPVHEGRELQRVVAGLPLHKPTEVTVVRDGKTKTLHVQIEEQPQEFGSARVPAPRAPRRDRETVRVEKYGLEL